MTFNLGLSWGMHRVTLPIVTLGTIRPEERVAARNATEFRIKLHTEIQVSVVWACLNLDPLEMPRTPYQASEGKRSQ